MKKLFVEIADTPIKREYGLMDRKKLGSNEGMLFKFPSKYKLSFWMRNTYIPLDIAFIDDDGKILQIEQMAPLSTKSIQSKYECKFALEVNRDWFKNNNIKEGSYIVSETLNKKNKNIYAQGFIDKIKNFLKNPNKNNNSREENVEGEGYPDSLLLENKNSTQDSINKNILYNRDIRSIVQLAKDYNLNMNIMYWTLKGNILPPRKIMPIPNQGYKIEKTKNGECLFAYDISPNIEGGEGWFIKGNQIKSFIIDNIIKLTLLDKNDKEMTPEIIVKMIKGNSPK